MFTFYSFFIWEESVMSMGARFVATGFAMCASILSSAGAWASEGEAGKAVYDGELSGFDYAYPVNRFEFTSQGEPVRMAYLDVAPETPNGRTVVLMHGKNFCAGTWEGVIPPFVTAGLSRGLTGL